MCLRLKNAKLWNSLQFFFEAFNLFVYIIDVNSVSTVFMPILFTDDTNLLCRGQNIDNLVQ